MARLLALVLLGAVVAGVVVPNPWLPTVATITYGGGGPVVVETNGSAVDEWLGPIGEEGPSTMPIPTSRPAATVSESRETAPIPTEVPESGAGLDRERLAVLIHERVNEERAERGLQELAYDEDLEEIAAYHSQDMAAKGYFAHTAPSGESPSDRFERFGYECRIPMGDGRYITGGAENVLKYPYVISPERIANGAVDEWMDSPGHRENILRPEFRREGVGVGVSESGEVYLTQNFC